MSTLAEQTIEVLKTEFDKVYQAGYVKGKAEGGNFYDEFWDSYQQNGNISEYRGVFAGKGWNDDTFNPKYDIVSNYEWENAVFQYSAISDLKGILERNGLTMDFSKSYTFTNFFNNNVNLKTVPSMNVEKAQSLVSTFNYCLSLETIEGLLNIPATCTFYNTFLYCYALKDIYLTGVIGNDISFAQSSELTDESVQNIINCLADLTGQTSKKVSFNSVVSAKLTDEQQLQIILKNWVLG